VPTIDLCELTSGQRASERLSTRIIIVNYPNGSGVSHLLGLIAEHATELLRKGTKDFVASGVKMGMAPYLGPILMDGNGPIQWVHEERLLPENVRDLLFSQTEQLSYETG
jgi:chemotaxis-related protein WspB